MATTIAARLNPKLTFPATDEDPPPRSLPTDPLMQGTPELSIKALRRISLLRVGHPNLEDSVPAVVETVRIRRFSKTPYPKPDISLA